LSLFSVAFVATSRLACADCAVHHERNMREEQHHMYVARTSK